jgi:hypothetical protein
MIGAKRALRKMLDIIKHLLGFDRDMSIILIEAQFANISWISLLYNSGFRIFWLEVFGQCQLPKGFFFDFFI